MMRRRGTLLYSVVILVLAAAGVAAAAYVLVQERAPVPFTNTYDVSVELTAANGVQPGLGQPVNVAGVKVGQIVGDTLGADGNARVTMQINRSQVPHIYVDATAALAPITPLSDMEMNLDPGRPPARPLRSGATIVVGSSSSPVPFSDLLSTLDSDTRDYMTSMLASFDVATQRRGPDLRRALLALGPTTAQLHKITGALAQRRLALASLVHNLALVMRAASRDGQLASLVKAGDTTLHALAAEDAPLRSSIAQMPATLQDAQLTLSHAATFADQLGPTLGALMPAVSRLPKTLATLGRFSRVGTASLSGEIRPLVKEAQPLLGQLAPATTELRALAPYMTGAFQVLNYFFNELAYVAGGNDQGFLFWGSWFFHNGASVFANADAHGTIGTATAYATCSQLTAPLGTVTKIFLIATGIAGLCSGK
jgi:phospholipid/cholesterol/gamma-HCH transport system substrate-binding protein